MLLDRHRMARLIELSALERTVRDPERTLREEDVALLIKPAYDDATEAARAAFMARVKPMPTSAWPWSAVQALAPRATTGVGRLFGVSIAPPPGAPLTPALLILLRGQAETPDADPGNRLPARESPEGIPWEPLHQALDAWDTATITAWIGPMGWVSRAGATAGQQVPSGTGPTGSSTGAGTSTGTTPSGEPEPTSAPPAAFSWKHPAVIAAGASVASTIGVLLFSRRRRAVPAQEKP
jgi:hypothetical protein